MGRYILSVFLLMYPRDVARSENLGGQVDGDDAQGCRQGGLQPPSF